MINQTKSQPSTNKFYGNYRAIVVDNEPKDEDGNPVYTGKIKVRVIGVHDDVDEEALPWAEYSDPFMGGFEDLGGFFVPNLEAKVWVFFEAGDHDHPVYFAGAPAKPHMPAEREVEKYPQNKVFKTKAGFTFEIDDSEGNTRLRIYQPSGNEKLSDNGGNVTELVVGNQTDTIEKNLDTAIGLSEQRSVGGDSTTSVDGNKSTDVGGDINTVADSNITMSTGNGNAVKINSDGTVDIEVSGKFSVSNNTGELLSWLSDLMQALATTKINTIYGLSPLLKAPDIAALKTELDTMKK